MPTIDDRAGDFFVEAASMLNSRELSRFILGPLLMLGGCADESSNPSSAPPKIEHTVEVLSHDFGPVSVDGGVARLEHTFRIGNGTKHDMEIKDIKKSCGCLEATPTKRHIAPGESTQVTLALELRKAGPTAQAATIICADGQLIPMRLQATGTREFEFTPIMLERTPHEGSVPIRFYLVAKGSQTDIESLELTSPDGMALEFDGWRTIERPSTSPGRPTRLVGSGRINLSNFKGTLPTKVTFRAGRLVETSIQIGESLPPKCP